MEKGITHNNLVEAADGKFLLLVLDHLQLKYYTLLLIFLLFEMGKAFHYQNFFGYPNHPDAKEG